MFLKRLLNDLATEKSKLEKYVTQGQIQDFASYRFFVGRIQGLQDAIDITREQFKIEENNE